MPKGHLLARDLMTRKLVTVPASMPVTSVTRLLADRAISAVPVTDAAGRLVGIVTEADLLRRLSSAEDTAPNWLAGLFRDADRQAEHYARTHGREAGDVMTTGLVVVEGDATAEHCAHLMEEHRIKRLPVVSEDGRLLGIVSRADLLRAVLSPPARIGIEAGDRDARIHAALEAEVREQHWAHSLYVSTDVKDGVVTLHGFVRSDVLRRGLRVLAGRIEGVERVEDRMEDAPLFVPGEVV